jgi:inner membrane protein
MTILKITRTNGFKALLLGVMILLLLIPVAMIKGIIHERTMLAREAEEEIMRAWGDEFLIMGPVLQIPMVEYEEIKTKNDSGEEKTETRRHEGVYRFTPEKLDADVELTTEIKKRGIFSVPLYGGEIHLSGSFDPAKIGADLKPNQEIFREKAELVIALSGQRGIRGITTAEWNGVSLEFLSGSQGFSLWEHGGQGGIHCPVRLAGTADDRTNSFDIRMEVQGGKSLRMVPLGGDTSLVVKADWNAPSFRGSYLPIEKTIDEKGFEARWRISHLSRNIPASWTGMQVISSELADARFGVDFFKALDHYALNTRAVKYALLFLIVPFLSLFLIEIILRRTAIHPVQYLLAGIGNVAFYLLLLAFSEHIPFTAAYWIAACAVTLMMGLYSRSLLGAWNRSALMGVIMPLCYAFLYCTLQSEDWALLIGALGCFTIIATVMFCTRRLDWYGCGSRKNDDHDKSIEDNAGAIG